MDHSHEDGEGAVDAVLLTRQDPRTTRHRRVPTTHGPATAPENCETRAMLVAHTNHAPVRFSMLETLRAYGRERLAERGEVVNACAAHATHHVEFAEAADVGLRGAE